MEHHTIEHRIGSSIQERASILGDVGVTLNRVVMLAMPIGVFFSTLSFYAARAIARLLGWL